MPNILTFGAGFVSYQSRKTRREGGGIQENGRALSYMGAHHCMQGRGNDFDGCERE